MEQPSVKRQTLTVDAVFGIMRNSFQRLVKDEPSTELLARTAEAHVLGDAVLLSALFDNLLRWTMRGTKKLMAQAHVTDRFVDIAIHNPDITPSDEELQDTFHPAVDKIPMLVAKQIIREHDIYCGNPGLRLFAMQDEGGGYAIHFTLLKK